MVDPFGVVIGEPLVVEKDDCESTEVDLSEAFGLVLVFEVEFEEGANTAPLPPTSNAINTPASAQ